MNIDIRLCVVTGLCTLALSGCSFNDASRVEADFGNSVRQMVEEQIYDKQAASNPSEDVMELDGVIGDNIMKAYRGELEEKEEEPSEKALLITF